MFAFSTTTNDRSHYTGSRSQTRDGMSSEMLKENGKPFQFQANRPETIDPDLSIQYLVRGEVDEFKQYVLRFPNGVNAKNRTHGSVPLHVASSKGDTALISFLLHCGAEVNLQDTFGNSPLHYATDKSKRPAIEMLLHNGANPNLQDYRGNSPLHSACVNNDVESVRLLLQFQADPELPDFRNVKPRDKAKSPMVKSILDRRIHAINGGDADATKQTVQFMSFGVGLGVGLGVAMAKHQQFMLEQHLAKFDMKPRRKGGFVTGQQRDDASQAMVLHEASSVTPSIKVPSERKFL